MEPEKLSHVNDAEPEPEATADKEPNNEIQPAPNDAGGYGAGDYGVVRYGE